ncbi:amidohydrolase family protein [Amycolatopsis acidicola]|uniref:Amidohydrolase family protein n=1 Tax=Amycolatopsis acidicola TaxID=2596893 RepID=A0A5N0UUW9_9PSEU|nr:amidohydrolase family protein [Amycolatopsis acidicola]KAA9153610.1 amidohydrolase family protein [Amycolatopsis acidicola]
MAMRIAVRAERLFDGSRMLADPVLVLDGTRIAGVDYDFPPPPDALVVDLPGATLLPGLIDTHLHLAFDASPDPVAALATRDDDAALRAMGVAARRALRAGVTTVRDLGDRGYLALTMRDRPGHLPTILASGPPITVPGGHCHYLGGAVAPGGIRAAVREHAERGVDVIKIMASGGTYTPGTRQEDPQFEPGEIRAAVEEAHQHGLPVTVHAHATKSIVDAVDAGVDGIEHVSFWSADGVDVPPPELIRRIARQRIVVGATMGIRPVPGVQPPAKVARRLPLIHANLHRLVKADARLVAGSDGGLSPLKPHDVLPRALPLLVRIGYRPAQALRVLTEVAAEACGLAGRKGRLARGFDADVLAVDGDPIEDPAALCRVRAVFAMGSRIAAGVPPPG